MLTRLSSSAVERRPEEASVPSSTLGGATKEIVSSFDETISFEVTPNFLC